MAIIGGTDRLVGGGLEEGTTSSSLVPSLVGHVLGRVATTPLAKRRTMR
jgi:hypothetical protein